jgi:hypothetical protein
MGRGCSTHEIEDECIQAFGGETTEKEALGRPRCRWEDNIKIDLRETG